MSPSQRPAVAAIAASLVNRMRYHRVFDHAVDLRRRDNNAGPGISFVPAAPANGFGGVTASRFASPADMQKAMDAYYTEHKTQH